MSYLQLNNENKLVMTWEAFEGLASLMTKVLRDLEAQRSVPYTGVYGFPRGGLVLAVKLSHALGLPLLMAPAKGCIVCDDISDSGETLLKYQRSADYVTATLLVRKGTSAIPAVAGEYVPGHEWILFPWEA